MAFTKQITLTGEGGGSISFYAAPEIEESGQALYFQLDDIRSVSSIMVWMGSPSRIFNINAKLISRTVEEATENFLNKSLLQSWRMPKNGSNSPSSVPEVITLSGYQGNFLEIPCVMKSLNISYPIDVDYIESSSGPNVPIVWPISMSLTEYHTDDQRTAFDYSAYQSGTLDDWS